MEESKLSFDMIYEILSRSSLKTLASSRLVSKEFNLLSYDSTFLNLHSRRTNTLSGFFMQTTKHNKTSAAFLSPENPECKISLDFLPVSSLTIKASSMQGFLVCVHDTARVPQYYVCKPITKEWQLIPNPKTRFFTESMGIQLLRSNPSHYKILRLSRPNQRFVGKHYCLRSEIFDSRVGKWRQIQQVKLPYDEQLISCNPPISACGKFHWLTTKNNVFGFDVDDEKYYLFSLPNTSNHYDHVHLTSYESKLGVICNKDSFFELWVMEIYQKKEWSKRVIVSTESVKEQHMQTCNPVAFCNADVALVPGFYSCLFFKFKNGSRIDKVRLESNVIPQGVFPFRSDMELCHMKNELFNKRSNSKLRKNKSKQRKEEYLNHIVFLLVLFFFTLFCFVLDL
ncbi:putative F-box protein At1g19160 [Euphorbia lathyris]|uniref:putative F-box protein At1g19160 n=1 Tax=Euphorbia lathyris TaxID=212925 RepID=UPI003313570B